MRRRRPMQHRRRLHCGRVYSEVRGRVRPDRRLPRSGKLRCGDGPMQHGPDERRLQLQERVPERRSLQPSDRSMRRSLQARRHAVHRRDMHRGSVRAGPDRFEQHSVGRERSHVRGERLRWRGQRRRARRLDELRGHDELGGGTRKRRGQRGELRLRARRRFELAHEGNLGASPRGPRDERSTQRTSAKRRTYELSARPVPPGRSKTPIASSKRANEDIAKSLDRGLKVPRSAEPVPRERGGS